MKFLASIGLILSLSIPMNAAFAGMQCRTDYFGNVTCTTGSGSSTHGGTTYTGRTDYFGNQTWTGTDGSRQTCRTDYFGNYTCN